MSTRRPLKNSLKCLSNTLDVGDPRLRGLTKRVNFTQESKTTSVSRGTSKREEGQGKMMVIRFVEGSTGDGGRRGYNGSTSCQD